MAPLVSLLVVAILAAGVRSGGGVGVVAMEEEELFGLFEVMGSLLDDPTWAQTHPLPCTDTPWPGLECELLEETLTFHVTKIHVGEDVVSPPCKPSAKIPHSSFRKLPYLKTLSLINCFTNSPLSLTKPLFLSLSSLEHLTLQSNPTLAGEIPPTISHLSNLKILSLSQNNLSGEIPTEIGRLVNLQQLDLSHNNLIGPIPAEIGNLEKLSILDISWNSLQESVPTSIGKLGFLEKMDLSWNKLQGRLTHEMGKLRSLVLLDLSHNSFTSPIPETMSHLQQLQYLIMEGNPLNSSIPSFIASLTKLTVLSLSGCGLTGSIPSTLSNLTCLTALSLENNSLNGTVPGELGRLSSLDTLNLRRNHLTGELLFSQDFMNRLGQRLDIRENDGLCSNQELEMSNTSSRFMQNPTCSSAIFGGARNKTTVVERNPEPNLYDGNKSSDIGHDSIQKMVQLFPGLVLMFLMFGF